MKNKKLRVLIKNRLSHRNAERIEIAGVEYLVVRSTGSFIPGSVMNGILYPEDESIALVESIEGKVPAPLGHPYDENGDNVSASSVDGMRFNIGAYTENYRIIDGIVVRDIYIDIEMAMKSEGGAEIIRRIESGEDVDTSTGILMMIEERSGIAVDGERYDRVAKNMVMDHDALLIYERGASTSDNGVGAGLRVNSQSVVKDPADEFIGEDKLEQECYDFVTNASIPSLTMPLSLGAFITADAVQSIREYTGSVDKPSVHYRKFFLEFDRDNADEFSAYKMPFAEVINGVPHANLNAIKSYANDVMDGDNERAKSAVHRYVNNMDEEIDSMDIFQKVIKYIEKLFSSDYNGVRINSDLNKKTFEEGDKVMNKFVKVLNDAGVKTEGMSEDQIVEAYNSHITALNKNDGEDSKVEALTATVNTLSEKLDMVLNSQASKEQEERDALVAKIEGFNVGLEEGELKALSINSLKKMVAKFDEGEASLNVNSGFGGRDNKGAHDYDMPE